MFRTFAFSIVFVFFTAFSCAAQSSDSGPQPQSPTQTPAAPQTASPDAGAAGAAASNQTKKKPKKVWTNEEMPSIGGNISVVGDPSRSNYARETTNSTNGNNAERIEAYRKQILQFRRQMEALDKQIAGFRNFKADNSSGGMNPNGRYTMTSPEDRIKQLEDKKRQIQAKIDAVEEAARKEGIDPGQLR